MTVAFDLIILVHLWYKLTELVLYKTRIQIIIIVHKCLIGTF